jgi:hypothetical protein
MRWVLEIVSTILNKFLPVGSQITGRVMHTFYIL